MSKHRRLINFSEGSTIASTRRPNRIAPFAWLKSMPTQSWRQTRSDRQPVPTPESEPADGCVDWAICRAV